MLLSQFSNCYAEDYPTSCMLKEVQILDMNSDTCLLEIKFRWEHVPENISIYQVNEICRIVVFADIYIPMWGKSKWITEYVDGGWVKENSFWATSRIWRITLNESNWNSFPNDTYKIVFYMGLNTSTFGHISYPGIDIENYEAELDSSWLNREEEIPNDELKKFEDVFRLELTIKHAASFIKQFQPILDTIEIIRVLSWIIISIMLILPFLLRTRFFINLLGGKKRFDYKIFTEIGIGILVFWPVFLLGLRTYCPPWPTRIDMIARDNVLLSAFIIMMSIMIQIVYANKD